MTSIPATAPAPPQQGGGIGAVHEVESDSDQNDDKDNNNHSDVDKQLMDASAIINSMRSVVEDQLRNLEPPMPLFTRPRQRQEWGDIQETPHKEWGDIFFDLVRTVYSTQYRTC